MNGEDPRRVRRAAIAVTASLVTAIALTWPLVLVLGREVPGRRLEGDVALNLWAMSWIYHQAPRNPLALLDANAFHPNQRTLAYSDVLYGQAILGLPAASAGPAAAYGLAFLLARAAAALAMALAVARFVPTAVGWWSGGFAGLAFASLPYLDGHLGHLQLQPIAVFPLLSVAVMSFLERPGARRALALAGVVAAGAWLSAYYAVLLALQAAVMFAILAAGAPAARTRRTLGWLLAAAVAAAALAAPALAPHLDDSRARGIHMARNAAADALDFLPWENDPGDRAVEERQLGVPMVVAVLAAIGLVRLIRTAGTRAAGVSILVLAIVGVVLATGPDGPLGPGYAVLMKLPGFAAIRATARFGILTLTSLTLGAGVGLGAVLSSSRPAAVRRALALLAVAALWPSLRPMPRVIVPPPDPADQFLITAPRSGAVIYLPAATVAEETGSLHMLSSRAHFRPIVNGYSGMRPPEYRPLLAQLAELPRAGALRVAADLGVAYAVRRTLPTTGEGEGLATAARDGRRGVRLVFATPEVEVFELPDAAGVTALSGDDADDGSADHRHDAVPLATLGPLPFAVGERLRYVATWSGLQAGEAELVVAPGDDDGFRINGEASTTRWVRSMYDAGFRVEVTTDSRLSPLRVRRENRESGKRETTEASFDAGRGEISVGEMVFPLAAEALDPVAAAYALRAVRFGERGSQLRVPLNDLGTALDLIVTVVDANQAVVELDLVAYERGVRGRELAFQVRLENGGARRLLEIRAPLPIGEVVLTLAP